MTREKVSTNVAFPLKGLRLGRYGSQEAAAAAGGGWGADSTRRGRKERKEQEAAGEGDRDGAGPEYDLYAVINHFGTLHGGHYTATCRAPGGAGGGGRGRMRCRAPGSPLSRMTSRGGTKAPACPTQPELRTRARGRSCGAAPCAAPCAMTRVQFGSQRPVL